jgi:hypothetical protein
MTTQTKLSAKHFQTPLLRTLGKLTGYTAGVEVRGEDTYQGILDLMGLASVDDYGENAASGQPQIIKWIQWANVNTRKAGQTEMIGRGKWALTDAGVQEALRAARAAGETPQAAPAPTAAPAAPQAAPAAPKLNLVLPTTPESGYHADAYVRKLAIDQTGCFGNVSTHGASVCSDCPLRGECRNRQLGTLSKLAAVLAAESAKPVAKAAKAAKADPKATKADPKAAPSGKRWAGKIDFSGVDIIKNHSDAICAECGQTIGKGERCRWVEELPGSDDGGLFHLGCSGGE